MLIRVEVVNNDGEKSSLDLEGDLLKAVVIKKLITFLNTEFSHSSTENEIYGDELTIKERLAYFLKYDEKAPKEWFTSSELMKIYEEVYNERIRLSTISTYLAKMHLEGLLDRKGSRAKRKYRLASETFFKKENFAKEKTFS